MPVASQPISSRSVPWESPLSLGDLPPNASTNDRRMESSSRTATTRSSPFAVGGATNGRGPGRGRGRGRGGNTGNGPASRNRSAAITNLAGVTTVIAFGILPQAVVRVNVLTT